MRVVIAPDSFKGTATAGEAARALADGWLSVDPSTEVDLRPMADGGEGTLEAFDAQPGAELRVARVTGPDGRPVVARWVALERPEGMTAVIELAQSSGLTLMDAPSPLDAHTWGLGEVIAAAVDAGAQRMLVAVGGSASTDGGTGALRALGARLLDAAGDPVPLGARGLESLSRMDLGGLPDLPPGGVVVLTDVTNPLTGPDGAAAVYGPQKGARPVHVARMDTALGRLVTVARAEAARHAEHSAGDAGNDPATVDPAAAGAGAAGGTGYGLALWGATLEPGAPAVADAIGLTGALAGADLVISGEGRFDGQSARGKVVSEVARRASAAGVPVALVAGSIQASTRGFGAALSLATLAGSSEAAMADPLRWLREAGARLARASALRRPSSGDERP